METHKWLIKWYPNGIHQWLTVYDLNVLDECDPISKNYQQDIRDELNELLASRVKIGSYYARNNKWMRIIEVDSLKEAVDIFFDEFDNKEVTAE